MIKLVPVLLLLSAGQVSFAQDYNALQPRTKTVIDSTYNALMLKNKIQGASLAIVRDGEIIYSTGYGFADAANNIAADDKTIFRVGSITKSFTALALLQLREKGLVQLDAPVKNYLPELTIGSRFGDNNEIVVRDMLTHTSGLPCDVTNGFFCDAPPDINWLIKELNKQTTIYPRNYSFAYSNVAYGLLGEIIARAEQTSYNDYVKQHLFAPLDMTSSFIEWDETLGKRFAKGYIDGKESKDPLIRDQAAGLIHSTAIDMAHYVQLYLNNGAFNGQQIVDSALLQEMEQNHVKDVYLNEGASYGYALFSRRYKVRTDSDSSIVTVIGHGGDTYLHHADFVFIPELNIGAVMLTNSERGPYMNSAAQLLEIYLREETQQRIDLKNPVKAADSSKRETACAPSEMTGDYNFGPFVMRVKNPDKLTFRQGPAKIVLKPKSEDANVYSMKVKLLGIIPIKVKTQEFKFVQLDGNVFAKGVNVKSGKEQYLAVRTALPAIPESWKGTYGKYTLVGEYYACKDCPAVDMEDAVMTIREKDGFVIMEIHAKKMDRTTNLNIVSEKLGVTGGLGRGTGEAVNIQENGNIYYSGFEFGKVK